MTQDSAPTAAPPLSLLKRFVGVIVSPGETMESIAAHPTWYPILAICIVLMAGAQFWFLSTEVGQAAYVDQGVANVEAWSGTVTDQAYAAIERQAPFARYIIGGSILVMSPIVTVIIAGILYGVFAVLGGEATFKQVLAVAAHTSPLGVVQTLFTVPLNYQRQSMGSATNLGVFFPNLAEGSFIGALLGYIDLYFIWFLIVLAIGLAAVYRRKASSIATGLLGVYAVIGLVVAIVKAAMGGR